MGPSMTPLAAHPSNRRAWLRATLALSASSALGLAGCGFELRRAPTLPFSVIHLAGFAADSPMLAALRQAVAMTTTTRVSDLPAQAQVVLTSVTDRKERNVTVSTSVGQVREIQLRARFAFRLSRPDGHELLPLTEIVQFRDMTYNERNALAKEQEEAHLVRAMQTDIAMQVLRRLTVVQPNA